jgi:DMSO reductase family type II enzyme chaperone
MPLGFPRTVEASSMDTSQPTPLSASERSMIYRGFAEAFRSSDGGLDLLHEDMVPRPPENANQAFVDAFDTGVSASACSLHESDYSKREQMSLFEELVRWHDHFGLRRKDTAELPDHVSAELEFMHFLTFQEHVHNNDTDATTTLRGAQRDFLERHLLPFSKGIAEACASPAARYKALAHQLPVFLAVEFKALSGAP